MRQKKIENRLWILPLCIGLLGAFLAGGPSDKERQLQQEIAGRILRFHVLANSDSREDQEEKQRVRDAVIKELKPALEQAASRKETKEVIEDQLPEIIRTASSAAAPRKVEASLVTDYFPEKTYGDCTFPEGEYEALRIEIGEAQGHNWWCVLYPGLCFEDAVNPVVPEEGKKELKGILSDEEYDFILHPGKTKIRFRWF